MLRHLITIIIAFQGIALCGQDICDGNLGDNIFTIGDFGSGEDAIVNVNPDIAPGYSYTTNPPPGDGFYILTNDMSSPEWSNLYQTWLAIGDNSSDPNGYMMVVNASFEPGIFYEEIVDGLCENQLYEFSADVINLIRVGVAGHHEPNLSFLLDDQVQYSSGIVPQDAIWHKYGFTFTTAPGQTSVKLTLSNNAPGGIGNDLALDNISFRPCGPDAFANAEVEFLLCANGIEPIEIVASTDESLAIQWQFLSLITNQWENINGATENIVFHDIFTPGMYQYRYLTAGSATNLENTKCRVISDTATVTVIPIEFIVFDTICENVEYEFGSQMLTEAGFYEETFIASNGCDSFVDLNLTVVPQADIAFEISKLDPTCYGYNNGSIVISDVTGGTDPITFFINNEANSSGSFFDLQSGNYSIQIRDRFFCGETVVIELLDPEVFIFDLGQDTSIDLGATYNFTYEANYDVVSVDWTGAELACNPCIENSARPLLGEFYTATAISEFGCIDSSDIFLLINDIEEQFYQPNIFSPNEDGINDNFQIFTNSPAIDQVEIFLIADRWGNSVFLRKNLPFGDSELVWDGYFGRNKAEEGVFSYFMKLRLINGDRVFIKGDVTLVR